MGAPVLMMRNAEIEKIASKRVDEGSMSLKDYRVLMEKVGLLFRGKVKKVNDLSKPEPQAHFIESDDTEDVIFYKAMISMEYRPKNGDEVEYVINYDIKYNTDYHYYTARHVWQIKKPK